MINGNIVNLKQQPTRRLAYTGLALGGPLDGLVISHPSPSLVVAKVPGYNPRALADIEVDTARFETIAYTYIALLAYDPPFGLFISDTLQEEHPGEPPLVTGVRAMVQRYADTTKDKAVPVERSEHRRH